MTPEPAGVEPGSAGRSSVGERLADARAPLAVATAALGGAALGPFARRTLGAASRSAAIVLLIVAALVLLWAWRRRVAAHVKGWLMYVHNGIPISSIIVRNEQRILD